MNKTRKLVHKVNIISIDKFIIVKIEYIPY